MESKWCRAKCRQQQQSIHDRSNGLPDQNAYLWKADFSLVLADFSLVRATCGGVQNVLAWETRKAERFGVSCQRMEGRDGAREWREKERALHLHGLDIFKYVVLGLLVEDFYVQESSR